MDLIGAAAKPDPEIGKKGFRSLLIQASSRATAGADGKVLAAIALLLIAGVAIRLFLTFASTQVPPASDMAEYLALSRALATGPLPFPTNRAIAYPIFLAGLASAGLGSLRNIYAVQSGLTMAAVFLIAWHTRSV